MSNTTTTDEPLISPSQSLPELTFKVIVLSIVLAALLAAANAYLALKIGMTISASIPASVLAIGILRFFKNSNVLECNIIQTAASAGEGIAAAIAFVLPALIVLHFWEAFPYWETVLITVVGGLLGVLFSIPLRRVLLHLPALRFPEGTAIGNVLKASTQPGRSIKALAFGGGGGALISLAQGGFKLIADSLQLFYSTGSAVFGAALGFVPATLAAGFIIGIEVGISILTGVVIGWFVLLPILAEHFGLSGSSSYLQAMNIWSHHLRYVGVGTMLVGGVWTLLRLLKPVVQGVRTSFRSLRDERGMKMKLPRTERDMPIHWVTVGVVLLALCVYMLVMHLVVQSDFSMTHGYTAFVVFSTVVYILIVGFLLATICGYFSGLIGVSNNPISGMVISAILLLGVIYLLLFHFQGSGEAMKVTSLVILVATVVSAIAAISNENLQDLKAGYMVGATPWKQQLILSVGVVVSALVIAPVLQLLFDAYGIGGVFPRSGMDPSQMLAAPQATLMAAVAKGVIAHNLEWNMILVGAGVAVIVIIIDEYLKRKNHRLPALAVGVGIYLPPEITIPMIVGGFMNFIVKRALAKQRITHEVRHRKLQNGVLMASGMVAGSAIMGVLLAIPFVLMGSTDALRIVPKAFEPVAKGLGVVTLFGLCYWFYHICTSRKS